MDIPTIADILGEQQALMTVSVEVDLAIAAMKNAKNTAVGLIVMICKQVVKHPAVPRSSGIATLSPAATL